MLQQAFSKYTQFLTKIFGFVLNPSCRNSLPIFKPRLWPDGITRLTIAFINVYSDAETWFAFEDTNIVLVAYTDIHKVSSFQYTSFENNPAFSDVISYIKEPRRFRYKKLYCTDVPVDKLWEPT